MFNSTLCDWCSKCLLNCKWLETCRKIPTRCEHFAYKQKKKKNSTIARQIYADMPTKWPKWPKNADSKDVYRSPRTLLIPALFSMEAAKARFSLHKLVFRLLKWWKWLFACLLVYQCVFHLCVSVCPPTYVPACLSACWPTYLSFCLTDLLTDWIPCYYVFHTDYSWFTGYLSVCLVIGVDVVLTVVHLQFFWISGKVCSVYK